MMNKVTLVGNISNDPRKIEVNETSVTKFSMVMQERRKKKDSDEYENIPTFVEIDAWGGLSTFVSSYFQKGKPICVEGSLFNDNYVDKETGNKVYRMRVKASKVSFVPYDNSKKEEKVAAGSDSGDDVPF